MLHVCWKNTLVTLSFTAISRLCGLPGHRTHRSGFLPLGVFKIKRIHFYVVNAYGSRTPLKVRLSSRDDQYFETISHMQCVMVCKCKQKLFVFCRLYGLIFCVITFLFVCFKSSFLMLQVPFWRPFYDFIPWKSFCDDKEMCAAISNFRTFITINWTPRPRFLFLTSFLSLCLKIPVS